MSRRVNMAHALLHLGSFVQSLAITVMQPDDLVEFGRQTYSKSQNVDAWAEDALVDAGFNAEELEQLKAIPDKKGNLLLLGLGGGREAIPLARMGFRVTGVDYIPALVERAQENAAHRGVTIDGLVQEISFLDVPAGAYDVVWLSRELYSCVPTRLRRVGMVRKIAAALRPGGLFLCMFRWNPEPQPHWLQLETRPPNLEGQGAITIRDLVINALRMRPDRIILGAICTLGNLAYEAGDSLWQNVEFLHSFSSEHAIRSELEEGGLRIVEISTPSKCVRGCVVCEKPVQEERITEIITDIKTSQV